MRIATYNIYKFQGYPAEAAAAQLGGPESPQRIEHFTRVLQELDCDVIALQEGGVSADMMQTIARALGAYLVTIPSPGKWPGQILSRYPALESRVFSHFVPDPAVVPPLSRCAGWARLAVGGGRELGVFVLHLHPNQRALRDLEAEIIANRVAELLDVTPELVVLGDFNCNVDEPVHGRLKGLGFVNAMEAVGGGLRATMDTAGRTRLLTIDHIYVSPALSPRLVAAEVVTRPGFRHDELIEGVWDHSDHLPVVAELA